MIKTNEMKDAMRAWLDMKEGLSIMGYYIHASKLDRVEFEKFCVVFAPFIFETLDKIDKINETVDKEKDPDLEP